MFYARRRSAGMISGRGTNCTLTRDTADALNEYQQFIQKDPDYYEGYFNAGDALFRQEQYEGALDMYKKAQELNPRDPDIQYNIDLTQKKLSQKSKGKSQKDDKNKNGTERAAGTAKPELKRQKSKRGSERTGTAATGPTAAGQSGPAGRHGARNPELKGPAFRHDGGRGAGVIERETGPGKTIKGIFRQAIQ